MQVLPANDDGTVHLGGDHGAGEDTAADGDETSERALLVCADVVLASVLNPPRIAATSCPSLSCLWGRRTDVRALNGGLGRPEAQADVLVPSPATLALPLALSALRLCVLEDVWLLLEGAFALDRQLGGHDCDIGAIVGWLEWWVWWAAYELSCALRSESSKSALDFWAWHVGARLIPPRESCGLQAPMTDGMARVRVNKHG